MPNFLNLGLNRAMQEFHQYQVGFSKKKKKKKKKKRTEGPESCTDGETLIFWD